MSSTRAIRGTKGKVLLLLLACVVVAGLLTGINNTLTQFTDLKESNVICHQQEENLSIQLQVITDYKRRLEKSLKNEKAENQQKLVQLEDKNKEEKTKYEKQLSEATLKFESLQQHFNLLQTNFDDYKSKQETTLDKLQSTVKDLREQIKNLTREKESLKSKVIEVQTERDEIKRSMDENKDNKYQNESEKNHLEKENNELRRDLEVLKSKCPAYETLQEPPGEQVKSSSAKSVILGPDVGKGVMNLPPVASSKAASSSPSGAQVFLPPSKSTTNSGVKSSKGSLNGVWPIIIPTVTSERTNKNLKVPEGVVPIPVQKEESDNNGVNSRYRNAVEAAPLNNNIDKNDNAQEVLDIPNQNDKPKAENAGGYDGGLSFNENEAVQAKPNFEKQHIDNLGVPEADAKLFDQERPADYDDLQHDVPLEQNDPEEDDEPDNYGGKEPAIRN